jgi:hypothetical protein
MSESKWYVEEHELSGFWSWLIIILFSASLAGYGWLVYCIVPDAPRHWDFGELPDTPAESIYSTEVPKPTLRPQRQLLRLPEAQPDDSPASAPK